MSKQEHHRLLVDMLRQVAPHGEPEGLSLEPPVFADVETFGRSLDRELNEAAEGLRVISEGRELTDEQAFGLEAIILPKYRPVVDIVRDDFVEPPAPWAHLAGGDARRHLQTAIPSIGRVEIPGHPRLPYAGTAFVVGPELLMTNRHVAEVFCTGLGMRRLILRREFRPGIDFVQEVDSRESVMLEIRDVVLIHPYWDMAMLRVIGLEAGHPAVRLGVAHPEDLEDHDIAVIGYPAQDPRNDYALQYQIFRGVFDVKRLQPGKLKAREHIVDSFGNHVHAVTHDASTLGGNSGSAVIDVSTGEVVGLHFGGRYLQANYAVPTYELARDHRVVNAGVNFAGQLPSTDEWEEKWRAADVGETSMQSGVPGDQKALQQSVPVTSSSATLLQVGSFTLPLHVTVSVGTPAVAAGPAAAGPATTPSAALAPDAREVPLRIPVIYDELDSRAGYDPGFLELEDEVEVRLPALTAVGEAAAARLDNGSTELKYHKFSIVMHKGRRLALLTAANVDWREHKRTVAGRKPSRRELTGIPDGFGEQWVTDPRIPDAHQLPDISFTKDRSAFDKGHLVRRDDVCWGDSFEDIQMANGDTFHTTNCSPQVAGFNQATQGEFNWGDLENLVQQQTKAEKAIVLAGPVFAEDDPEFRGRDSHGTVRIKIPQKYWKIIVVRGEDGPEAYGFVLEQDLGDVAWEFAVPAEWEPHTARVADIEALLNSLVTFGPLRDYDQTQSVVSRRLEESLGAVRARGSGRNRAAGRPRPETLSVAHRPQFALDALAADGFDWRTALSLALCSQLSYCPAADIVRIARDQWSLATCDFLSAGATQCFIASSPDVILVAFRGTENLADWITDMKIRKTARPYGTVHRGFCTAFEDIRAVVRRKIDHLGDGQRKLLLTGHSLGAALSVIAAADLWHEYPAHAVYTFGQPRVGKRDFAELGGRRFGTRFYRIVNANDIVTRLPPRYVHFGTLLHLDARGQLRSQSLESAAGETELPPLTEGEFRELRAVLAAAGNVTHCAHDTAAEPPAARLAQTETLFPGFADHAIDRYIAHLARIASGVSPTAIDAY